MQFRARISRQTGIALGSLEQKSNHNMMLIAVNKWLCMAEMEMRFGVRLTSAMLDNGNMKNMLCFAGTKICLCTRDQILLTRNLESTDTSMKLTSGTDCDNPLATEATCAGVEFCCPSSDSFGALNEEATQDSASSSHEALAVTEKPNVLLTTQTSAQLTVMKDTGLLRRLHDFFSGSAHDSRCGQKHVIKAVESFFLRALRRWR